MGTKYAILLALVSFAIFSRPAMTLARSIPESSFLGAFDITNKAGADIYAQCIVLAEQGDTWSLGQTTLTRGSNWGLSIQKPANSIYVNAISCSFSMAGFQDVSQSMWEESDVLYDLPVQCIDCHWIVDQEGFAMINPANGHYRYVAYWGTSRVTSTRAQSDRRSLLGPYVGTFDITNKAGADIGAQCVGISDNGDTWALGSATVEIGSKWGLGIKNPTTSVSATAISCSFSLAGFLDENLAVWEKSDNTQYGADCSWIVDLTGFSIMNPENGKYISIANWTPPGR